jgi:GTP-binding protein Era
VGDLHPHAGDLELLAELPAGKPIVLVLNKIDLVRDKQQLLPLMDALSRIRELAALVPVSALREDGIERVLDEVARLLPEGEARHEQDDLTDRPMKFFAAEYIREPILQATSEEVPHAVAVTIDRYLEPATAGEPVRVAATIHVERPGQKAILVGRGGESVGAIRRAAQSRLAELTGQRVVLELWVCVTPNWRDRPECLADFGFGAQTGGPEKP